MRNEFTAKFPRINEMRVDWSIATQFVSNATPLAGFIRGRVHRRSMHLHTALFLPPFLHPPRSLHPLPLIRDEAERFPFSLDCETIFYRGALTLAQRGFIIYAMGYANYDKVQIFHMTCTCVTPLSTRERLTKHVNRDARKGVCIIYICVYILYTCVYITFSKFRRPSWNRGSLVISPEYT